MKEIKLVNDYIDDNGRFKSDFPKYNLCFCFDIAEVYIVGTGQVEIEAMYGIDNIGRKTIRLKVLEECYPYIKPNINMTAYIKILNETTAIIVSVIKTTTDLVFGINICNRCGAISRDLIEDKDINCFRCSGGKMKRTNNLYNNYKLGIDYIPEFLTS